MYHARFLNFAEEKDSHLEPGIRGSRVRLTLSVITCSLQVDEFSGKEKLKYRLIRC